MWKHWPRSPSVRNVMVRLALVVLVGAFALAGPISSNGEEVTTVPPGVQTIAPAELAEMLTAKDFLLVNVHVPYAGEIPQTDSFIPYDETTAKITSYPAERDAKIVVYCLTNRMALIAVRDLAAAGYTHVMMLDGGMKAWEKSRRTLLHRNAAPSLPYPSASKDGEGPVPDPCGCGTE
jgi:rhodanese-related sulfurtransferase